MPGPCCWIGICCDPPRARRALAEHLADGEPQERLDDLSQPRPGSYSDIAGRLLDEFALVPLDLGAASPRLEALHEHVKSELRAILTELGHDIEAEATP